MFQQQNSYVHHGPLSSRTVPYERTIKVRPSEHDVSSSERPHYVLVNSEPPDFAENRKQSPLHRESARNSISMYEPGEHRLERVLPSIEKDPRAIIIAGDETHLASLGEQREPTYPISDNRAVESSRDRTSRFIEFDHERGIQQVKRRRVDERGFYSPVGSSRDCVLIPIGQSDASRYEREKPQARLAIDNSRTVSYTQHSAFLRPVDSANVSSQRPYSLSNNQARREHVGEGPRHPIAFQSPPSSHVRFPRPIIEAEGRPLSYSLSDHAHRFQGPSQSAVLNHRELDSSHYGVSTPYVSSHRYETVPLDSTHYDVRRGLAEHGSTVTEGEYSQHVHERPMDGVHFQVQRVLHDVPHVEERGQMTYIPVQQDRGTPRIQYRPRTQLPLERCYQDLQPMIEIPQSRYQDAIHPAGEDYDRVVHHPQIIQSEDPPYAVYEDPHMAGLRSTALRPDERDHLRSQRVTLAQEGQRYAMALRRIRSRK